MIGINPKHHWVGAERAKYYRGQPIVRFGGHGREQDGGFSFRPEYIGMLPVAETLFDTRQ